MSFQKQGVALPVSVVLIIHSYRACAGVIIKWQADQQQA